MLLSGAVPQSLLMWLKPCAADLEPSADGCRQTMLALWRRSTLRHTGVRISQAETPLSN